MKVLFQIFLGFLLCGLFFLGCGGSGGGGDDDDAPIDENTEIELSLELYDSITNEITNTISSTSPGELRISLETIDGTPLDGRLISVTTTKGTLSPLDGSVLTDSGGTAVIEIDPGIATGAGELSVSYDSEITTIAFQITSSTGGNISSINFISSDPKTISLAGTGGISRVETSKLIFQVMDEFGVPVEGEQVDFELSTTVGGITLSAENGITNSDGNVSVSVNSGTIHTSVRVTVNIYSDPLISTISDEIVISSGVPDQDSFSLSLETFNPEAWNYDGVEVEITIRAADHFNNPVPAGTMVAFTTEGGSIDPSCQTDETGACSVTWRSQAPRLDNGRVTILATAIGDESFIDSNGNGWYDATEPLVTDLPETFRDDNDNTTFDDGWEEFLDFNSDGIYTPANGIYNGVLCSDDAKQTEDGTTELVHVRDSLRLNMSESHARISFSDMGGNPINQVNLTSATGVSSQTVIVTIGGYYNNLPMPYETTISAETSNGDIDGTSSWTEPNNPSPSPSQYLVALKREESPNKTSSGFLTITVTTPKENLTEARLPVVDDVAVDDEEDSQ
ncbi:MAG: Ig-like domain-containing protein [Deltaproteobacteria bacterium]|nr:Ig-like domain-containing protein [Deltaproteobacteria bacterium]